MKWYTVAERPVKTGEFIYFYNNITHYKEPYFGVGYVFDEVTISQPNGLNFSRFIWHIDSIKCYVPLSDLEETYPKDKE